MYTKSEHCPRRPHRTTLRKHAYMYSNILEILQKKKKKKKKIFFFSIKKFDMFHISAQTIHCAYSLEKPRRGGSNPQSMSESSHLSVAVMTPTSKKLERHIAFGSSFRPSVPHTLPCESYLSQSLKSWRAY